MTISSDSPTARLYKSILDAHYYQKHNDRFAMTVALQETKTIVKHNPNVIWISVKIFIKRSLNLQFKMVLLKQE